MIEGKKIMKIGSIIKMILGLIWIKEPIIGLVIILSGLLLYSIINDEKKDIAQNKNWIVILAIISISDVVGSTLTFVGLNNYLSENQISNPKKAPPKVVYVVDKETKKIDLLLKLGVGMVFASGLLFSTTTWAFISNIVKVIVLIAFGILFLVLSNVTEKRFKLYQSSFIYWILSMSFFTLTIVAILYFQLFGRYLSFMGLGYNLAYMIVFLTGSAFTFITYLKYPKKLLLYITYTGVVISMIFLLNHVELSSMMIICALSIITLLTNILISKKTTLFRYSKVLTYFLCILCLSLNGKPVETSITCLINIVSINYLYLLEKNNVSFISIIITYILIAYGLLSYSNAGEVVLLLITLAASLYTLLMYSNIIPLEDNRRQENYYLYTIMVAYSFINTIDPSYNNICIYQILIAIIYFIINIMIKYGLLNIKKLSITRYTEPISIFAVVFSILNIIIDKNAVLYTYTISSILFCLLHYLKNNKEEKNIYEWSIIIAAMLSIMVNNNMLIPFLLIILPSLYVFTITIEKDDNRTKKIISYILLLTSLNAPFIYFNILKLELLYIVFMFIILMIFISYCLRDKVITKISYFYAVIPLLSLIEEYHFSMIIQDILHSILLLYITFIIIKFFIKESMLKNIIGIIGIVLFTAGIFFIDDLIAGIYIGILGIIIISLGYKKEELFPIFITGLILTILNIIYRLIDVWRGIPFWLYLLIGGLAIIGFVMYKEIKKMSDKK